MKTVCFSLSLIKGAYHFEVAAFFGWLERISGLSVLSPGLDREKSRISVFVSCLGDYMVGDKLQYWEIFSKKMEIK